MSHTDTRPRVVAGTDRAATLKELIAESGVPLGGFELSPRSEQTQPKKIATACELAAMDFTPWKMEDPQRVTYNSEPSGHSDGAGCYVREIALPRSL
jgi:hypothetical protein